MSVPAPIRVLVVDDSRMHRTAITSFLGHAGGFQVVGEACDGVEAVDAAATLKPDVILMDVQMPNLDGLKATQRIMAQCPRPILLMTAADNLAADVSLGLKALEYGALDLIAKPDLRELQTDKGGFAARLRLLAGVPVISHMSGRHDERRQAAAAGSPLARTDFFKRAGKLVAIVASTGGPKALKDILQALPSDLRGAVVVVQHIDPAFEGGLVQWLDDECDLKVVTPRDGHDLYAGFAYVAPQRRYAEVTERRRLALIEEPIPAGAHCPSGDRLMRSVARAYGKNAIGVVLTGIGSDGADGLLAMRNSGALTIAQDEATSVVYGMPRAAALAGAAELVLPLHRIAQAILEGLAR